MLDLYAITLDLDWAPECAIRHAARTLQEHGVRATWMVTHQSEAVRDLAARSELFELGVHPNFRPGSTHGTDERAVLGHVMSLVPGAKVMRAHSLHQSTQILEMARRDFGLEADVSLLLPRAGGLEPHDLCFKDGTPPLVRIPYFYEDAEEMLHPRGCWDAADGRFHVNGLKVFNFHPSLVYLNADSTARYEALKRSGPLARLTEAQVAPFRDERALGAGLLFRQLCEWLAGKATRTCSEVVREWRSQPRDA